MELEQIKTQIDEKITFWRNARKQSVDKDDVFNQYLATVYIDAFQQVRKMIFDETLPTTMDIQVGKDYVQLITDLVKHRINKNDN